ncbi:hypothetical protein EON80_08090 [bacterium]|nr:MAG: hypothetical protein EON80_08090 [bacterium]
MPRAVWEQLLRDVEDLKKSRDTVTTPAPPPVVTTPNPSIAWPAPSDAPSGATGTSTSSVGSRNYLLLPDISFVGTSQYLFSNDKRDEGRNSLDMEGELGVQGFVYPNVKYDTFITGNPGEEEFGIEEGYMTYLGAAKGLNVQIGRKFVPFGRTGELHPHSWLYSRQFLARQNLVAGEALAGNGINLNYLLPTGKKLFARLSLGAFSAGEGAGARINSSDPSDPFEGGAPNRVGSGLSRFYNARLWLSKPLGQSDEVELGFSRAQGRASLENLSGVDPDGNETVDDAAGRVKLTGIDFSYRHFSGVNKRFLLRSELFKYKPRNLPTTDAEGYYMMGNYRFNRFDNVGLIYEKSDFANAPGLKEKATSLIYTHAFSERYYVRMTGIHGDRPGENNYNEGRVQFVIGLGPHTHELE